MRFFKYENILDNFFTFRTGFSMHFTSQMGATPSLSTTRWDQFQGSTPFQSNQICAPIERGQEPTTSFSFHAGLFALTTVLGGMALLSLDSKPLDSLKAVVEFGKTGLIRLFQKIHKPSFEEDEVKHERVLDYLKREFLHHTVIEMTLMNALHSDQMQTLFKFARRGGEKRIEAIAIKKADDAVQTIKQCHEKGFLFDKSCFSTAQKEQMLKNLGLEEAILPIQSSIGLAECSPWYLYMQAVSLALEGKISIDGSNYEKASLDILDQIQEMMRPDKKMIAEALAATAAHLVKELQPKLSGSSAFEEIHAKIAFKRVYLELTVRFYEDMEIPLSELGQLDPQNPYRTVIGAVQCEDLSAFFWNRLLLKQIYQTEYTKNPTLWDQPMTLPQLVDHLKAEGDKACAW